MGALDEWGKIIGEAASAAGIAWEVVHEDGQYLYMLRLVDENGTPSRTLLTPGDMCGMLGIVPPWNTTYTTGTQQ